MDGTDLTGAVARTIEAITGKRKDIPAFRQGESDPSSVCAKRKVLFRPRAKNVKKLISSTLYNARRAQFVTMQIHFFPKIWELSIFPRAVNCLVTDALLQFPLVSIRIRARLGLVRESYETRPAVFLLRGSQIMGKLFQRCQRDSFGHAPVHGFRDRSLRLWSVVIAMPALIPPVGLDLSLGQRR
jgi:hypothetical protein